LEEKTRFNLGEGYVFLMRKNLDPLQKTTLCTYSILTVTRKGRFDNHVP
jgi:hypothetical protein